MTAATWVIALASLVTALTNGYFGLRHRHADDTRFAEHGERIEQLENGHG